MHKLLAVFARTSINDKNFVSFYVLYFLCPQYLDNVISTNSIACVQNIVKNTPKTIREIEKQIVQCFAMQFLSDNSLDVGHHSMFSEDYFSLLKTSNDS